MTVFYSHNMTIIDSLHPNEMQTGRALQESILDLNVGIDIKRVRCETGSEVLNTLQGIKNDLIQTGEIPLIHIEGHGDKNNLRVPNGFHIPWKSIINELQAINILTCNNLFLSIGACESIYAYSNVSITEPCSVFGMLAPAQTVEAGEIKNAFCSFYQALFETSDVAIALSKLTESVDAKKFSYILSNFQFEKAACKYLTQHCMGKGRVTRTEELLTTARIQKQLDIRSTRKAIKRELKKTQARHIHGFHQKFLMLDRCPDNKSRFPFNAARFERDVRVGKIKCV